MAASASAFRPTVKAAGQADTARRYRLYPAPGQAERLTAWGHAGRAVWNLALEQRRFAWEQRRHTIVTGVFIWLQIDDQRQRSLVTGADIALKTMEVEP